MPRYDIANINLGGGLTTTQENNVATTLQQPLASVTTQEVNWQMLASYLDSSIFQFILQNKDIPEVTQFGVKLATELATNFNITR